MTTKLTCPDCGGVIGPREPGESPCSCFENQTTPRAGSASLDLESAEASPQATAARSEHDTVTDPPTVDTGGKYCFKCGANVTGKKRWKDSRGYICADCNAAEIEAEKTGTVKCPDCGRRLRPQALIEFQGKMICKLCANEQREADKKKIKVISSKVYEENDRKRLIVLCVIAFILLLLMIRSYFLVRAG